MQGISLFYVMELLQRAKQLEEQGGDIIHMEIGEPEFPPQKLCWRRDSNVLNPVRLNILLPQDFPSYVLQSPIITGSNTA